MKKLRRIGTSDVGRLCLVKWDDIGRVECLITSADIGNQTIEIFMFADKCTDTVSHDEIAEFGNHITPNSILESTLCSKCKKQ